MFLNKILGSIAFAAIIALSACDNAKTMTAPEVLVPTASVSSVANDNNWQTWNINWYSQCTGRTYSGSYRIHLQSQNKLNSDGSVLFTQHYNVGDGRLTDESGNEYIFQNIGKFTENNFPVIGYSVVSINSYKVVSKGRMPNEFVDVALGLDWDGTNFVVTFSQVLNCRGE